MRKRKPRTAIRNLRLGIESLEDRRVLAPVTVSTGSDVEDGNIASIALLVSDPGLDGRISLREAISAANQDVAADTIEFAANLNGQTIQLSSSPIGRLAIFNSVTIDASMLADGLIIQAAPNDNVVTVSGNGSTVVTLMHLTLTGGDVAGNGGAIQSTASLDLEKCTIIGNNAVGQGGGIVATVSNGQIKITNSTIHSNHVFGLNHNGGGALTIESSAISGIRVV